MLARIKRESDVPEEGLPDCEVLTIEEVAAFLRVDPDELEDDLVSMPVFEIGGRLRMRKSKLLEWMEERERRSLARRLLATTTDPTIQAQAKRVLEAKPGRPRGGRAGMPPHDPKRTAQIKAQLARRAPKGYHLACYLDCGPDTTDGGKGKPILKLASGQPYRWARSDLDGDRLLSLGVVRLLEIIGEAAGRVPEEVRAQCPQAEIVFDQFHVIAKYGREVIDRVRLEEARRLEKDQPARKVVKGSRWLLLRSAENLKPAERVRLRELLAANRRLATVYVLKDDLKRLWDYRLLPWAAQFWQEWYARALPVR